MISLVLLWSKFNHNVLCSELYRLQNDIWMHLPGLVAKHKQKMRILKNKPHRKLNTTLLFLFPQDITLLLPTTCITVFPFPFPFLMSRLTFVFIYIYWIHVICSMIHYSATVKCIRPEVSFYKSLSFRYIFRPWMYNITTFISEKQKNMATNFSSF